MRALRYNFLALGLMLTLGLTAVMAGGNDQKPKKPKNTGTLSVKTSETALPVKVDGVYVGMSGVAQGAEFYLPPGVHSVEVTAPDGKVFKDDIEIIKDRKSCLCLKTITETTTTPCPYRFHLEGPERVTEGDLVTFAAINSGTAPVPLRYAWKVSPSTVRISSGLGTPSITVDSKGMGGQTISAELDVNDDVYDNKCRQLISVPTDVTPKEKPPQPYKCDEFEAQNPDQDKARFDNCVIQAQNTPDAQLYVIIYPGTDKASLSRNSYDRLSKRALDYMVKTRGFDPRRISVVRGSNRLKTTVEIWVVPPGAQPPVVQ
jgi:hypothetical protein